jgi:hypothetical protein
VLLLGSLLEWQVMSAQTAIRPSNSLIIRAASLFCRENTLFCGKKFAVRSHREFVRKSFETLTKMNVKINLVGRFSRNSLFFSLLAGKMPAETGPNGTASATKNSS